MAVVELIYDVKPYSYITSNPTKILSNGEPIYLSDGRYGFGDGITTLSSLPLYGGSGYAFTGLTSQYTRGDGTYATFPTNVSSFTNDSGYITSSALSPYLTIANAALTYQPIGSYLTSSAIGVTVQGYSANTTLLGNSTTGTGSIVCGTQPTFTQWITVPRIYGGTGTNHGIDFYSTIGNGTAGSVAHRFLGGNNGATTILTMFNDGTIRIPNNRTIQGTDSAGTNRSLLVWSSGDNITITGRPGTTDINLNPTSGGIGLYVKSSGDGGIGISSPVARWHIVKTTEQLRVGYDTSNYASHTVNSIGSLTLGLTGTTPEFYVNNTGGVVIGNKAALATNATDGFLYVPSCAGVPTGVPTAKTGKIAVVCDSTNNKMYIYSGAAWVALN